MNRMHEGIGIAEHLPEADPDKMAKQSLEKIKHKLMVMSGKGGVGKTSVSVNLAMALAARGFKVWLMDVDVHGPDIPRMLGLSGMAGVSADRKILPVRFSENLSAVSIESLMPNKDDAVIWRGPVKHSAIRQFIGEVACGNLDFMIIDSPPGTGDEPLTVSKLIPDARAVIVTTPQEVALADVRKSISFCRTVNMQIFGLIENMSGYTCPNCGKVAEIFGSGGGEKTAIAAGIPFLGKIPFDPKMVQCSDAGVSYQKSYADSDVSRAFAVIVEKLVSW